LPAIAAGATAGVTAMVLVERFGVAAGVSAGLYVATNPMFVENSRDLRGYSVATLFGLLATIVFFGKWTRWRLVLYGLLLGLAIAAHAYAGLVLVAHVLWIVTRRSWGDLPRLAPAWALAAVAAAVSQVTGYTDDPLALRQAAAAVQQGDADGKRVCLIHSDEQVLGAYQASGFTVVTDASQLESCDEVVVVSWAIEIPVR